MPLNARVAKEKDFYQESKAIVINIHSWRISQLITYKDLFDKIELTATARVELFNLANMYNPKLGYIFANNYKLRACSGVKQLRTVNDGLTELESKNIIKIEIVKKYNKEERHIYFTDYFFNILGLYNPEQITSNIDNVSQNPEYNNNLYDNAVNDSVNAQNAFKIAQNANCNMYIKQSNINNISSCENKNLIDSQQNNDVNLKKTLQEEPIKTEQTDIKPIQETNKPNKLDDDLEKINFILKRTEPIFNNNNDIESIQVDQDKSSNKQEYSSEEKQKYKELIILLISWHFIGAQKAIKDHGLDKISKLCQIVKNKNNPGAYLRFLLNQSDTEIDYQINKLDFKQAQEHARNEERIRKQQEFEKLKAKIEAERMPARELALFNIKHFIKLNSSGVFNSQINKMIAEHNFTKEELEN